MHYLQKELLERLRADLDLFEFFDSSCLDGLWFLDMETMQDEWLSPKFKTALGYEPDEVPNTAAWWQEKVHPDDLPGVFDLLNRHIADPSVPFDQIIRYRHRDGSTVTVRCRGKALRDETGKPIRMLGTHTDVSELKDAEAALQTTNRTLNAFASTVAHDLKAPIRQVGVLAELTKSNIRGGDVNKAAEHLGAIRELSTRATGLVDGLLRLSQAHRYKPAPDARADLHDCARQAARAVGSDGADIHIDPMPEITGDAELLVTLLSNLITNAVKYNDKARTVIHVRSFVEGDHLVVQVDDNGPGIPSSEQERIFQPLERGSASADIEGHGIGLALCRTIADAHSGELAACPSQLGGACIELRFPRNFVVDPTVESVKRHESGGAAVSGSR